MMKVKTLNNSNAKLLTSSKVPKMQHSTKRMKVFQMNTKTKCIISHGILLASKNKNQGNPLLRRKTTFHRIFFPIPMIRIRILVKIAMIQLSYILLKRKILSHSCSRPINANKQEVVLGITSSNRKTDGQLGYRCTLPLSHRWTAQMMSSSQTSGSIKL